MPRRFQLLALSFWPGLAQIWAGQELLGLLLAAFFAASLNLSIVARWIWSDLLAPPWGEFLGTLTIVTWLASVLYTLWWVALCHPERHQREIDRLFRESQEAYLQGRWADARRRIERILARDDSDADALMFLGTIYIRTDQPAMARRAFVQCLELKAGAKWRWEIHQALTRLGKE
jgi:hypothetical protein